MEENNVDTESKQINKTLNDQTPLLIDVFTQIYQT